MKKLVFSMIVLLGALVVYPSYMYGDKGFDLLAEAKQWFNQVGDEVQNVDVLAPVSSKNVDIYKWQDEKGVWHFSDTQNTQKNAQVVTVNSDTNVIQAVKPIPTTVEESSGSSGESAAEKEDGESPLPYSPADVRDLIDDAKNIQNKLDERAQQQQELLNNL